jgi:hypothetical protein
MVVVGNALSEKETWSISYHRRRFQWRVVGSRRPRFTTTHSYLGDVIVQTQVRTLLQLQLMHVMALGSMVREKLNKSYYNHFYTGISKLQEKGYQFNIKI